MKKFSAILLSVLFLFNSCGYIFAYFQLSNIFKQDAEYKINHGYLPQEVTIIEDSPSVEKVEAGEIKFNGMKYDIIKTESKNGRLVYYCISDAQESNLDQVLINHVEKNSGSDSTAPVKNILHGLFSDILPPSGNSFIPGSCKTKYISPELIIYKYHYSNIATPPPRLS